VCANANCNDGTTKMCGLQRINAADQWGQVLNLEFSKSLIILSTIDLFEIQDSRPDPLVALEGPQCVVTSAAQDLIASGRVSPSRTPVTCTWVAIYGQQRTAKLII